jgi:hypothetical protein
MRSANFNLALSLVDTKSKSDPVDVIISLTPKHILFERDDIDVGFQGTMKMLPGSFRCHGYTIDGDATVTTLIQFYCNQGTNQFKLYMDIGDAGLTLPPDAASVVGTFIAISNTRDNIYVENRMRRLILGRVVGADRIDHVAGALGDKDYLEVVLTFENSLIGASLVNLTMHAIFPKIAYTGTVLVGRSGEVTDLSAVIDATELDSS